MKKLKKWQIVVLVLIVLGVIGAIAGGGSKDSDTPTSDKVADKGDDKKKDEPKKEKTYKIGEVQNVGKVEYTVNAKEVTDTVGTEYFNKKAQNKFLILTVTIKNNGKEALDVIDSFFKLKDGDKSFDTEFSSNAYIGDESIIAKKINPDTSFTGKIAFDIADGTIDSKNLQLQVQTGTWGTEKGYFNLNK